MTGVQTCALPIYAGECRQQHFKRVHLVEYGFLVFLQVARVGCRQAFQGGEQSFHVAEKFTGNPGVYVRVEDTVRSFAEIVDGKADDLPEQAFRYASTIEDVRERARKMGEK